jgi:predicted permease
MLDTMVHAASITAPSFCLIALGWLLRRRGAIDARFVNMGSRLIFNIGIPVALFLGMYRLDLTDSKAWYSISVAAGLVLLITLTAWLYGSRLGTSRAELGVFTQGAYRSNLAIIGLAICENAFGERGLAMAALPVGLLTAWYNVVAVYLLSTSHQSGPASALGVFTAMLKNPLIIGVGCGALVSLLNIPLPQLALDTGNSLARMAIPMALLLIGGSISLEVLKSGVKVALHSSLFRLLFAPAIMLSGMWLAGIEGELLAVYLLLAATPAAAASFVMVQAVGGNSGLAASIITLSTIGSVVSLTAWLAFLQAFVL